MKKIIGLALLIASSASSAGTLGIDLTGSRYAWTETAYDGATLGYSFSITEEQVVDGLGFWDQTAVFNTTYVGLWDSAGNLLGMVDTDTSPVSSFSTANGVGFWNFMEFDYTLSAGRYIVGAWGEDMEFTWSSEASAEESILNYLTAQYVEDVNQLTFPVYADGSDTGYFGGNISFASSTPVPLPGTLAMFGTAMAGLGLVRRRKIAA